MNGMPHGSGVLKNNFPGHFCIHFYGSTTHSSRSPDLSHHLMVLKAAGKLEEHLLSLNPVDAAEAYLAGWKENDPFIVRILSLQSLPFEKAMSAIDAISMIKIAPLPEEKPENPFILSIPAEVDWVVKNGGIRSFKGTIQLVRFSLYDSWKVDSEQFFKDNHFPIKKAS